MSQTGTHVTLLIPGLNLREVKALAEFPELQLLLTRAKVSEAQGKDKEAALFEAFGFEGLHPDTLPVAWAGYVGETGDTTADYCLRCDPVHLVADRDELLLVAAEGLALKQVEADWLVNAINEHFASEPWQLEACAPHGWYLRLADTPDLQTHPLRDVLGKPIAPYMPQGEAARYWRSITNEAQMLLHGCMVNNEREAAGQMSINGLWLWGGGRCRFPLPRSSWSLVWSNEPVSRGLSLVSGTPCETLPQDARAWLQQPMVPGEKLIVLDGLEAAWQRDEVQWHERLQAMAAHWINPLLEALRRRQLESLSINACNGQVFRLTRGGLRCWWRRDVRLKSS